MIDSLGISQRYLYELEYNEDQGIEFTRLRICFINSQLKDPMVAYSP